MIRWYDHWRRVCHVLSLGNSLWNAMAHREKDPSGPYEATPIVTIRLYLLCHGGSLAEIMLRGTWEA